MKVTLVFPSITITGFNSFGTSSYTANWINHGLCSISAYAKASGFKVDLIDLRKCKNWQNFESILRKKKPDIIGIGMMSLDYNPVMKCLEIIKKVSKQIITVIGGIHPTCDISSLESNENIDYIIQGEGEISFTELLKKIENNPANDRIIQGIRPDLDKIPFCDRELFDYQETIKHPFKNFFDLLPIPFVTIMTSRGCIYNCSFCQPAERKLFGKKVRQRSVNNVIEELKLLRERYHFNSLMIHDDCLLEGKKWVVDFCDQYEYNGFKQPFYCQGRADIICKNEDMLKRLKSVGLTCISIGFESGSQRVLDFLRKGVKIEENYRAAEICKKYNISIIGNFMLGIPTETKREVWETVRMIKKVKPYHIGVTCFTPYPGSDLYTYCKKNNLFLIRNYDAYSRGEFSPKVKGINYLFLRYARLKAVSMGILPWFLSIPAVKKIHKSFVLTKIITELKNYAWFRKIRDYLLNIRF